MVSAYIALAYSLIYIGLFATTFYIINLFLYYKKKSDPLPKDDKTITIIIPAYNEEKSIERTLESALKLDYPKEKIEIFVIDDGSKDRTYELAKKFANNKLSKGKIVKVYTKPNGGKGTALNYGIERAKGEIVFTMDADTFASPDSLKKMIGYFYDDKIMCVSPSMTVYNPKTVWEKIVQIEYYLGVFLRKSFASMNAIHVSPGAFSAYRRSFFVKYGGYDEHNITEDLEVALRIQANGGRIENAPNATVYTLSPDSFKGLLYQRRRWYIGMIKNLWAYRRLFGPKKGPLGAVVLPAAVLTISLSVVLTIYSLVRVINHVITEINIFNSINFHFNSFFEMNSYVIERIFFELFTNPIFLFSLLFISLLGFYMHYSRKQLVYKDRLKLNVFLFLISYSILFAFWWTVSFIYTLFNRKVAWGAKNK